MPHLLFSAPTTGILDNPGCTHHMQAVVRRFDGPGVVITASPQCPAEGDRVLEPRQGLFTLTLRSTGASWRTHLKW